MKPPKTIPPAGNQVFRHRNLCWTFAIQTLTGYPRDPPPHFSPHTPSWVKPQAEPSALFSGLSTKDQFGELRFKVSNWRKVSTCPPCHARRMLAAALGTPDAGLSSGLILFSWLFASCLPPQMLQGPTSSLHLAQVHAQPLASVMCLPTRSAASVGNVLSCIACGL